MAKSNKKSDLKHKGISHKQQGEVAKERGLSDSRMLPLGRLTRGIGSSYAHAVAGLLDSAKSEKGSDKDSFLGEKKITIDPKEYAHSLNKKKK